MLFGSFLPNPSHFASLLYFRFQIKLKTVEVARSIFLVTFHKIVTCKIFLQVTCTVPMTCKLHNDKSINNETIVTT